MFKYPLFILLFWVIYTTQLTAQVTIGVDKYPNAGALLQLQNLNTTGGDANADKGLGLPRVPLESKFKLLPMLNATESVDPDMKLKHTGLLVYNVGYLFYPYCEGMYVWDGDEWEPFMKREEVAQPTITDGENNTYTYQKIGDKYWLTQNVRTITENAEGINLINTSGLIVSINPGYQTLGAGSGKGILVGQSLSVPIPNPNETIEYYERLVGVPTATKITLTRNEFANKFGFVYSQAASKKACPTGWRFPTDADWNNLVVALGGWEVAGKRLKSENTAYTSVDVATPTIWDAYSRCDPRNSGFNALPSGASDINNGSNVLHFGLNTRWWSETNAKAYGLDIGQDRLMTWTNLNTFHYPVRCVRDTDPKL